MSRFITALKRSLCGLLLILVAHAQQASSPSDQPASRTPRSIEGWNVLVDDRLLDGPDGELGNRAMKFLEAKLFEITVIVPRGPLEQLRKVTIVLDRNCGDLRSMQYHPSAGWLNANGYPITLAKCVHLPRAADLPTARNINEQPWVILHELAHAYHDQVLGFDEPRLVAAFEKYKSSRRGDATMLYDGSRVKHYALTDQKEFFAEMTESYFGTNDFYPFNRAELRDSEPEIHQALAEIWR